MMNERREPTLNDAATGPDGSERVARAPVPPVPDEGRRMPSLVWLMPVLALGLAFYVVWSTYSQRGPLITIAFPAAAGMAAGTTEVRIRDIAVGLVEDVGFSPDLSFVEARVRIDKAVAHHVDADARFWLVQPQVTARGVTGIGTLLSGVYIGADWDAQPGEPQDRFEALPIPPLRTTGEQGTRIVLRTRAGRPPTAGAPILSSGIEVGRLGQPALSETGTTITTEAFVVSPHDQRLTSNTRFWDASGLALNVGTGGVSLKVDSLASLLEGGINFATPVVGGTPAKEGQVFDVFANEAAARADAFEASADPDLAVSIMLDTDVAGIAVGTPVRFRGIKAGEVEDIVGIAPPDGEAGRIRLRVDLNVDPSRIGLPSGLGPGDSVQALRKRVERGLRARVASEGLFGQTVVVELANLPGKGEGAFEVGPQGRMWLPTAPASLKDGSASVEALVARVSSLPIEELMAAATSALAGVGTVTDRVEKVLSADGMDRIPGSIEQTLAEFRGLATDIRKGGVVKNLNAAAASLDKVVAGYRTDSRFYGDLREVLRQISSTAEAFRSLARSIERNPSSLITGGN